ncbi:MAG: hypothetical protein J6Y34_07765 [Bacteroidales bacterium]|nr:hypothetical protein [Bacteroidales bacterium]
MRKIGLLLLFCGCMLASCWKEPSDVFIFATDSEGVASVQSGNKLLIRIQAVSDNYKVDRIRISSLDAEKGQQQLMDTLIGGMKRTEFYYTYTVPSYFTADTALLTLQFEAVASNGGSSKMVLKYRVVGGASLIPYDGIIMYGARSGRANGFSLASAQTLYCETADTSTIDIYDYHDTLSGDTSGRLSREWRSRTGLQFARMNDFDYSGTNQLLLNNAFKASRRYTSLKDIAEGDVVLFGRADQALGVLQVLMVADEAGNTNDRYVFNLKKVRINNPTPEPDTTSTDTTRRLLR